MVTLRLLGTASLEGEDGPVTGRTAQRRRVALLALLAMSRGQALSRDKVIGFLWAESDGEKARRLLSESLYVIRKTLGEESLLASGDDLRLNKDVFWIDALEFLEALDQGDVEAASRLYQGSFLDGFFLKDATEFEHWVDEKRVFLERRFADALRKFAEEADERKDWEASVAWWRRLSELDRYDGQVAAAFMRALESAGQRAAALQHAQVHAALLQAEFDAAPDPEVEELAERLKEGPLSPPDPGPSGAAEEPTLSPPLVSSPSAPVETASPGMGRDLAPAQEIRPYRISSGRRWALGGVGLVGFSLILATFLGRGLKEAGAPPAQTPDRTVVAVLPFTIHGEVGRTLREGGLATLLSIDLDGVEGFRSVDEDALWYYLGQPGSEDPLSQEDALRAVRHFQADYYVQGRIIGGADGTVRAAAILSSVDASLPDPPEVVVDGSSADPISLADSLTLGLLAGIQETRGEHLSGIAALTTQSIPALNAFLIGEEEFRATRYGRAEEAFERAVREDPTFALAHYRRSISALQDLDFDVARLSAERAVRNSHRLTGRDRELLTAWNSLMEGEAEESERQYLRILRDYPDEVEAHFGLGEARVYFHPVRGLSPTQAKTNFEDVLRLNPGYGQARFHLLELATARRDSTAFDTLFSSVDSLSDQALAWETVRAFWADGNTEEQRAIEERLREAAPLVAGLAVARVAAHLQDYPTAERLAGLLAGNDRDAETRAAAQILIAMMRFAQGGWQSGMDALDVARRFDPAWATVLETFYLGYPLRQVSPQEALGARETLVDWEADQVGLSTNFVLFAHNGFHRSLRLYLLALTSIWAGETEAGLLYAGELPRVHSDRGNAAIAAGWAQSIRARVAAAGGRTEEGIRGLEDVELNAPLERIAISPFFSRAYDRYTLGQLLTSVGRTEEALSWFRSLTEGYEVVFVAPAHLQMARILDEAGDWDEAARHYGRFLELWEAPDQEFQPLVDEARERLSVLRASPADSGATPH